LPSSSHIIGVVVGGRGEIAEQVLDLTQPYGITSIATLATDTSLSNTRRFPALLRFAPGNDVLVCLDILNHFRFFKILSINL